MIGRLMWDQRWKWLDEEEQKEKEAAAAAAEEDEVEEEEEEDYGDEEDPPPLPQQLRLTAMRSQRVAKKTCSIPHLFYLNIANK